MLFKKYNIWLKSIAIGTVCLFSINTLSWAIPVPRNSSQATLAVPSIFDDIVATIRQKHDITRLENTKRIEHEAMFIIRMAWKGLNALPEDDAFQYTSGANINFALDSQYDDTKAIWPYDRRYRKLLEVTSDPKRLDNGAIEIHVSTTRPAKRQREFTVVFKGDKVEDMLDRDKIEITPTPEAEENELAKEGQRPELEPHQKDVTNSVKNLLRNRLENLPLESQIIEFLEKYDLKFIKGKPKKLPKGIPVDILKYPVCGISAHKVNEEKVIEGIEWDNIYLDSEDLEKNYWKIIHEIVEDAVILNLARTKEFKDETMQKLVKESYTDAMTYLVMRHYSDYFRFNRDEYLNVSYNFTGWLTEIMGDKSENIVSLLDNSVFSQEISSYFTIMAACLEMAKSMQQMGDVDFDGVLGKFDHDKKNGGLNEKEQEVALWLPDNFFSIINKTLLEEDRIDELFPTLSVFTPSFDAISPEEIKIPELHNFLNRASNYLDNYPVDMTIPLSLFPKEDLEENMKTWAYLIALYNSNKYNLDVNYMFESEDQEYRQRAERVLLAQIDALPLLEKEDKGKLKARVNNPHPHNAEKPPIKIRIMKKEELQNMRKGLPDDVLAVAMSEGETLEGIPVRYFTEASIIGLAQAVCKKAQQDDKKNAKFPDKEPILPGVVRDVFPIMQEIYGKLLPNKKITEQTIINMIAENKPIARRNLILDLALPPIARLAIEHLRKKYHNQIHLLLSAA